MELTAISDLQAEVQHNDRKYNVQSFAVPFAIAIGTPLAQVSECCQAYEFISASFPSGMRHCRDILAFQNQHNMRIRISTYAYATLQVLELV